MTGYKISPLGEGDQAAVFVPRNPNYEMTREEEALWNYLFREIRLYLYLGDDGLYFRDHRGALGYPVVDHDPNFVAVFLRPFFLPVQP